MSSMYDDADLDSELIIMPGINNLRISLIKENIKLQIMNPFETNTNFIETFNQECESIIEEPVSHDVIKRVNQEKILFYLEVIEMIDQQFNLDCDIESIGEKSVSDVDDICSALYSFFILKRKKNIKNMMLNYIINNEDSIIRDLSYLLKKKDVVTREKNAKLSPSNRTTILANLNTVLNYIKSLDIDMDVMIQYTDLDLFNNAMVKELMDTAVIRTDFQSIYFSPLFSYNDIVYMEIISKIESGLGR